MPTTTPILEEVFFLFVFFPAFYNLQSLPAHTTPLSRYLPYHASTLVTPEVQP